MKTVKLTQEEIDVILSLIVSGEEKLCERHCYCGYKTNMCLKKKSDGTYACRLKRALNSIENKIGE